MPDSQAKQPEEERQADFEMEIEPLSEGEEVHGQPAVGGLDGETNPVPRLVSFEPTRRFKGRLFSLKNNSTKRAGAHFAGATGHTFNYDEIYDEDPYGEETFPDARVWKVYNDEAQLFDLERIEAWRDAIDVLLVFIGLFAAVVSAFLIETSKSLQPDYAQLAVMVSFEILRSLNSSVLPHSTFSPNLLDPRFGEATKENTLVNTLWYTSLTISLSTALLAMLVKQWLHQFMVSTSGTARERARNRQFRNVGLDKYRVPLIIDLLPTLLHLALGLFLVGLSIYLKPLDNIMFGLVVGLAAIPYTFYIISITIPFFDAQCPYKSPPSFYIYPLQRYLFIALQPWLLQMQTWWIATLEPVQHVAQTLRQFSTPLLQWFRSGTQSILDGLKPVLSRARQFLRLPAAQSKEEGAESGPMNSADTVATSLGEAEKHTVSKKGHQLDVDGIVNLCQTSANTNVRNIALEAFGGLSPSDADVEAVYHIIDLDLHAAVRASRNADGIQIDNIASPGMEQSHDRLIRALCVRHDAYSGEPYELYMESPFPGKTDPRRIFGCWLFPWFEIEWKERCDFAALFAFASRETFPLPVWAALIRLAERHQPEDPVIGAILLPTLRLPVDSSEVGAVTFDRAMRNPFVRSIGSAYLGVSTADLEDTRPLLLPSITYLLSEGSIPHLEAVADDFQHLSPSDLPFISPIPYLLSSILPPLFRSLANQIWHTTLGDESKAILRTILTNFFTSPHINDVSWETLASATTMWSTTSPPSIRAITTSSTIRLALEALRHRDDPKEVEVESVRDTCVHLRWLFLYCLGDTAPEFCQAICSSIQELDLLPLDTESLAKTSTLHLFWQYFMCRFIVDWTFNYSKAQSRDEWFEDWITYLHAPERLTFMCSKLVGYDPDSLHNLCQIRPGHSSWPAVFENFLHLFGDRAYLNTMVDWRDDKIQKPQQYLFVALVKMKQVLLNHQPILSRRDFDIPQFDDTDNLIPSSSTFAPTIDDHRVPELRAEAKPTSNAGHSNDALGPTPSLTNLPLRTSPSNDLSRRASADIFGLNDTTQSTEPDPSVTSPGSFHTPSENLALATRSPASDVPEPPELSLNRPNHQLHSEMLEHTSVDMADDPGPCAVQVEGPASRGLLEVRRQSEESKVERGDLDR